MVSGQNYYFFYYQEWSVAMITPDLDCNRERDKK